MSRTWNLFLLLLVVAAVVMAVSVGWMSDVLSFLKKESILLGALASLVAVLIGIKALLQVGPEKKKPRPGKAEAAYLSYLRDRYCYLDVKGMGVNNRVPIKLPLIDLYVPLLARPELPEGQTWDREQIAGFGGRDLGAEEAERLGRRLSEPRRVLELVQEHDGLVILGDPGSGKTTFLKYLALKLAVGEGRELGLPGRLPILVPLSAFAKALDEKGGRLDEFIADHVTERGGDGDTKAMVEAALAKGRALLLLDGLDEVRDTGLRQAVASRITDFFAFHHGNGNKFVITSRVVGYEKVRTVAEGLAECTLVDFGLEEISDFVRRWAVAFERQARGAGRNAELEGEREREEMLAAVKSNPGVRKLAANPLLLTILALMKRQGVTLPERRVKLYEQYLETLLSSWNQARSLDRPTAEPLDTELTIRTLAPLARWMHEEDPGLGLVQLADLKRKLVEILRDREEAEPEARARQILEEVQEGSSLLLERGVGEFGFIHLTFEEYLAAASFALDAQGDAQEIVATLAPYLGKPAWREIALLLIGYLSLVMKLDRVAGQVLELVVAQPKSQALRHLEPGAAEVLAGEALRDVGPEGVPRASREAVTGALVRTMQSSQVVLRLRRQAGLQLGRMAWVPDDLDTFVEVPAGPFLYGDKKEERQVLEPFWIARYPVTNLQFAAFVDDGGYRREELWSEEGWGWWKKENREGPYDFGEEFTNPIFPRVGVTFYEAEAFACWFGLNAESFVVAGQEEPISARRVLVALPSEEQWERAARGVDGRAYPWGKKWEAALANTEETNLEKEQHLGTTAVCTFPGGRSSVKAWDMSGNVFEWTLPSEDTYSLPGGSFWQEKKLARCAARFRIIPVLFSDFIGFRLVLSPGVF